MHVILIAAHTWAYFKGFAVSVDGLETAVAVGQCCAQLIPEQAVIRSAGE